MFISATGFCLNEQLSSSIANEYELGVFLLSRGLLFSGVFFVVLCCTLLHMSIIQRMSNCRRAERNGAPSNAAKMSAHAEYSAFNVLWWGVG